MSDTIDPCQYAHHGHSTVHALIYLMQAIHEGIDSNQETALSGYFLQILLKGLMSYTIPYYFSSCARRLFFVAMETSQ